MQRKENESFEDYKARRAISNKAVKDINKDSRGGKEDTRANRPGKGIVAYSYGNLLRSHFAVRRLEEIKQRKEKQNG